MTATCLAPGCHQRDHHTPDCADTDCPGCQPAPPEYPRQFCRRCADRTAANLATIAARHAQLPAWLRHGAGAPGPRVSGGAADDAPLRIAVLDLDLPARMGSVRAAARGQVDGDPDQIGDLSIATELDFWVREWIDARQLGERLPIPTVPVLAAWLAEPARLDWALREYPVIDEFAGKMRELAGRLRNVEGDRPQPPQRCYERVPCSRCDTLGSLVWVVDSTDADGDRVQCGACGTRWTRAEYERYVRLIVAGERESVG